MDTLVVILLLDKGALQPLRLKFCNMDAVVVILLLDKGALQLTL